MRFKLAPSPSPVTRIGVTRSCRWQRSLASLAAPAKAGAAFISLWEFRNGFRSSHSIFAVRERFWEFAFGSGNSETDFAVRIRFSQLENDFGNSHSDLGIQKRISQFAFDFQIGRA